MLALVMYIGVLVLLLLWKQGVPAFNFSLRSINVYTVLFVLFFGIGYGAYYATADMPIPMVADCSDYETYRSGPVSYTHLDVYKRQLLYCCL